MPSFLLDVLRFVYVFRVTAFLHVMIVTVTTSAIAYKFKILFHSFIYLHHRLRHKCIQRPLLFSLVYYAKLHRHAKKRAMLCRKPVNVNRCECKAKGEWHCCIHSYFILCGHMTKSTSPTMLISTYSYTKEVNREYIVKESCVYVKRETFIFLMASFCAQMKLLRYKNTSLPEHEIKLIWVKNFTLSSNQFWFVCCLEIYTMKSFFNVFQSWRHVTAVIGKRVKRYKKRYKTFWAYETYAIIENFCSRYKRYVIWLEMFYVQFSHKVFCYRNVYERFQTDIESFPLIVHNQCKDIALLINFVCTVSNVFCIKSVNFLSDLFLTAPRKKLIEDKLQHCRHKFIHRLTSIMNPAAETESDTFSLNGDLVDMGLFNSDGMSDTELQRELENLSQPHESEDDENVMDTTVIECTAASQNLATPKVASVVVFPAPAPDKPKNHSISKEAKRNRNRNGSSKRDARNSRKVSSNTLVNMLSKVTVSNEGIATSKPVSSEKAKRIRSGETTPDSGKSSKQAKMEEPGQMKQSYSLVVRRTLNLKICITDRPPMGKDLAYIKQFLHGKIEEALANGSFLPIFNDVCKIEKDGVYVYCSDSLCVNWIYDVVKNGIPSLSSPLTVLPQDTPMLYRPEQIMVRTVTFIPTRQTKENILKNMAQLNSNLNTEKWRIKNLRPKGAGSVIHMRMDKKSFDTIRGQQHKINWILGPIIINQETHQPKHGKAASAPDTVAAESTSALGTNHFIPPSTEVVAGTPKEPGLTKYGGSGPKGYNKPTK